LDDSLHILTGERSIRELFKVLHRRTGRLIGDKRIRHRLNPLLGKFVCNIAMQFKDAGELDDFTLTNILTALSLADNHKSTPHGRVDYSTLIRRPNPLHPDSDSYFVVGREGRVDDPSCPVRRMGADPSAPSRIPPEQMAVFLGFYHARQMNPGRDAPKIRVEDFRGLVPVEIRENSDLEEAFTDVCLSDGAWDLYERKIAA
jgi:hypothetical protein